MGIVVKGIGWLPESWRIRVYPWQTSAGIRKHHKALMSVQQHE